mmetsp:Transcript_11621/g.21289  ORF Transcript_11621/g.21289 Transcript_11621/m.21289 type:complete len:142 (-) Transcript_11621:541-966(-)|eukprot:CAMPEP_0174288074 /NCGR_PEP_ID=MMETSP0809-20121228/18999_1 /TAXON_ID=73025 ORGANISM="Eutreptiella gymnastica-like, Strain CCMP1594" /NCGR_SAMPLE_ID=MMETSP0809 /ASSEMBLY_ACC=CAM_ASM_000658 /LENGTH=141 /DNA_ID=CAMNT_0015385003 /DNA_START=32 /DNA_END=457 /DNA_ORIENTATION=-
MAKHKPTGPRMKKEVKKKNDGKPKRSTKVRLWQPAVMCGYRRGQRNQNPHVSLLAIKGVKTRRETSFYMGKRVVYMFKALKKKGCAGSRQKPELMSKVRRIWGRIVKPHGQSGMVRAVFKPNLPAQAIGNRVRLYMYPSAI